MSCPFDPATASGAPASSAEQQRQNGNQNGNQSSHQNGRQNGQQSIPIPQPPPSLLRKNFPDIDPDFPARSFQNLADLYGEIYQVDLGHTRIIVSSQRLVNEVCDEDRFHKDVQGNLLELRALIGDGLFSAAHEDGAVLSKEPNWWKAHRLLIPAFGPLGLRRMFDDMLDISAQMVQHLDRLGENNIVDTSNDFTRLAFDTIGLCAFGYRFNGFYSDDAHPFAKQMANVLLLSGRRGTRTGLENRLHVWEERDRQADVKAMHDLAHRIVDERRQHPQPDARDLLNTLIHGVDKETGEGLSQDNIVYNMVTFLVAGHETTSGALAFMWYNLLKNPAKFHKAQQQVDQIVGDNVVTVDMLPKLTYLDACIKETLRLNGPIGFFGVVPREDTTLANGRYHVNKGTTISINVKGLHHDPAVWGDDANAFEPERFLDGGYQALPPHAWLPFGRGLRSCIGRGFAEQEMLINTAMILQRFTPELADPKYELKIKSTLTVKPDGLYIKMRRRPGKTLHTGIPGFAAVGTSAPEMHHGGSAAHGTATASSQPVNIFFGGNAGTCEGLAQVLQGNLSSHGVKSRIYNLDAATERLSKDVANLIITSSYEGKPADNAKKFVAWLESLSGDDTAKFRDAHFSVFGVGDHDWPTTFHRIPKLIQGKLQKMGAPEVAPAHYADVKVDLLGPFDDWAESVVQALSSEGAASRPKEALRVTVEKSGYVKSLEEQKLCIGAVLENIELADSSIGAAKMHMEIRLPESVSYIAGDYLVVQPRNPSETVRRVLRYFGLDESFRVTMSPSSKRFLPTEPIQLGAFFYDYVELATPITKRQLQVIAQYAKTEEQKQKLANYGADEAAWAKLVEKRHCVLDVLEENGVDGLPLETFIDMLLPLTPRQYSISSSPLAGKPHELSLTYDVHRGPAFSGHGIFQGVCSTFLASRKPRDQIYCYVRPSNVNFRLPTSPATPLILFAAGTGIAPMRAFLQERAAVAAARQAKPGPALLFYGCRSPSKDYLYKDELAEWEQQGIVTLLPAHSRAPEAGRPAYVPDAIWEQRQQCADLFTSGGRIYLCGSAGKLGKGCADACMKIYMDRKPGTTETEAQEWLDSIKTDRYISDVY